MAWIGVDPRPAIALLIYVGFLFVEAAGPVMFGVQPQFPWRMAVFFAGAALVAAAAIWRLHRQAVI